jgi:hypothetical protein
MKTIRLIAAFALTVAATTATGCSLSGSSATGAGTSGTSAKSDGPASGAPIEGLPLVADAPAGAGANEGLAGFHSDDESVYVMVRAASPTDALDFAAAKTEAEAILFKKWIKSEKTADGWILTYVGTGIDMNGKEYDAYTFDVRRRIADVNYECYGAVKKEADLQKNVQICQSLRAKT